MLVSTPQMDVLVQHPRSMNTPPMGGRTGHSVGWGGGGFTQPPPSPPVTPQVELKWSIQHAVPVEPVGTTQFFSPQGMLPGGGGGAGGPLSSFLSLGITFLVVSPVP